MGKMIKKGKKGEVAQYLTRAKVLKKLQVSLSEFRRLCILKGVYPRDPKKKAAGKDKTYFHVKDIRFLMHEPVLEKFRRDKTFMKKYQRLIGRKQKDAAKTYENKNKVTITLHHLVKERYPKFEDALRDIDDALCMAALFDTLPVDKQRMIGDDAVSESGKMLAELMLYIIRERRLRKVFASIKGFYYQADLNGVLVTWLAPHRFTQNLPEEVDFKVLLTFLDLHKTMLKFVNYRLYTQAGVKYPPTVEHKSAIMGGKVAALRVEHFDGQVKKAEEADTMDKSLTADFGEVEEVKAMTEKSQAERRQKHVFDGLRIFVGREVAFDPIYLCLRSCGAEVGWPREGSPFSEDDEGITHHILDRPLAHLNVVESREYVQPQWVFDCLNEGRLLPIADYAPGKSPPPHLSPFVDHDVEGYVPARREELQKLAAEHQASDAESGDEEEAEDPEELAQAELAAEVQGVASAEGIKGVTMSSKKGKAAAKSKEEEERLKSMMTKKHKRMLLRIDQRAATKEEKVTKLVTKRAKADAKKGK